MRSYYDLTPDEYDYDETDDFTRELTEEEARAEELAIAQEQNPPCSCCNGNGCGQCQYTGWR